MRKFSSYGPISTTSNYYAPRKALIERGLLQLVGEQTEEGGHYITVWAPRQTGKTWVMQQVLFTLMKDERFDVVKLNLQHLERVSDVDTIIDDIGQKIINALQLPQTETYTSQNIEKLFHQAVLRKPLIIILDEFDSLPQEAIRALAATFRNIYVHRRDDPRRNAEKEFLLHGVALIGVRSVLGIENESGSPFNVQRSLHIPNLTFDEVSGLFEDYAQESGQPIEADVIEHLYAETRGQPGLTCWFGELLTEGFQHYQPPQNDPITKKDFEIVYAAGVKVLPNSNILNIISKARQEPYKTVVLELLRTDRKVAFSYDDHRLNFLYMNGVIDIERQDATEYYARFACPFIQKRLFNYFAHELFRDMGKIFTPFENIDDTITDDTLNIKHLMRRYERHLQANREWLLKDVPRREDLRVYEAVYHFNLYVYLQDFLKTYDARVHPEFPTGNGKIDLLIDHGGNIYGLELKSYTNDRDFRKALQQAARYGQQLGVQQLALVVFVEAIDTNTRTRYETDYHDEETGVLVTPIFIATDA